MSGFGWARPVEHTADGSFSERDHGPSASPYPGSNGYRGNVKLKLQEALNACVPERVRIALEFK